jgi:hypothetical protein
MHRFAVAGAVMLCVAAAGCRGPFAFLRTERPEKVKKDYTAGGFGNAFGNVHALEQTPGLYVESVLLERPLGDSVLTRDVWTADVSDLPPKARAILEENGIRVAVAGGTLPASVRQLLESSGDIINPQGLTFAERREAVLPTVGPIEKCEYRVRTELSGEAAEVKLSGANAGLLVRPELLADGRVRLHCEPQLQHGERESFIRPAADGSGFRLEGERPLERYPSLGFDVSVRAGDYLFVGWPADADGSLGSALFSVDAKGETRQRVLVIRAGYREAPAPARLSPAIAAQVSRW